MGFGEFYFEEATGGKTFLDLYFDQIPRIQNVDYYAIVHEELQEKVYPYLDRFPIVRKVLIEKGSPAFYRDQIFVDKGRKWGYDTLRGGAHSYCVFDEMIPMQHLMFFCKKLNPQGILWLSPEMPFFDKNIAVQVFDSSKKQVQKLTLPFLFRPTTVGISPVLITRYGVELLAEEQSWRPSMCFCPPRHGESMPFFRIVVERDMNLDLRRGNFLLRTPEDLKKMRKIASHISSEKKPLTRDNLWRAIDSHPEEFVRSFPREIELDISNVPYPEGCKLPLKSIESPMPLQIFEKIIDEVCSCEDALLTLGTNADILQLENLRDYLAILKEKRPYGLHLVLNAAEFMNWSEPELFFQLRPDIITLLMTPISYSPELWARVKDDFPSKLKKGMKNLKVLETVIHLEIHKYPDIWRDIYKVEALANENNLSYNWVGYNDRAGQLPSMRALTFAPAKRAPCSSLINQITILPDGTVPLCKQDFKCLHSFGNVGKDSIETIWNCQSLKDLRKKHLDGDFDCTELCAKCKHWVHT